MFSEHKTEEYVYVADKCKPRRYTTFENEVIYFETTR